jgi:uncharacterized spore protein YtfJ
MDVQAMIDRAREAISGRMVFSEPVERDGVTVIPAARVHGTAGGGGGEGPEGQGGRGSGGGFGLSARPVGAFVIRGGEVIWRPAVDVNRIVLGGQIVALVAMLTLRSIVRARARARR